MATANDETNYEAYIVRGIVEVSILAKSKAEATDRFREGINYVRHPDINIVSVRGDIRG